MTIQVKQLAVYGGMIVAPLILIGVLASKLTPGSGGSTADAPALAKATALSAVPAAAPLVVAPQADDKKPESEAVTDKVPAPVAAKTADKPAPASAQINVLVKPWGEVYVDGKKQGVSPPLKKLPVAAGKHTIEIRNTTFPAYTQQIQVKAGEQIKIEHKF